MKEYRVTWCQCPHIYHDRGVLFIKAGSVEDARALAVGHIERKLGIEWFSIFSVNETKPVPEGEVL